MTPKARLGVHDRSSLWQLLEPPEVLVEEQIGGYGGYAGILGVTTNRFVFFSTREPESAFWITAPLAELLEVLVQGPARPLRGARIGVRFRRQPDRAPLRLMTHGGGVERAQELADAANRLSHMSSESADAELTSPALTVTEAAQRRIQSRGGEVWIHPNEVSEPSASYQPQPQTNYFAQAASGPTTVNIAEELRWFSGLHLDRARVSRSGVRAAAAPTPWTLRLR